MLYAVYADLSSPITTQERLALFEALDATVPGSGCVGPRKGPHDEVYFVVEALTEEEAREQAERFMNIVLQTAGLEIAYALTLQTS